MKAGDAITFTYSTPAPHPKNWIGLYTDPGNGPVDQKYVGPSLKWAYIPSGSGTARLDTDGLEPGDYVAYALAEDGYAWLAQPAKLRIVSSEPLRFVTSSIPLRNARAGSPYAATVRGPGQGRGLRLPQGQRPRLADRRPGRHDHRHAARLGLVQDGHRHGRG
ncbi:hypothetical protein [Nonomuraea dietziae]|uniref:hypothetical protein n=1 Tax=Nonomuraea dietziae TaxID=65515 RepID=UPI0031E20A24